MNGYQPQTTQYPTSAPPRVPNVTLLPQYANMLIPASSMIANLAVRSANGSQARRLAYDALSYNNWQNPEFDAAVKFAIDYHMLQSVTSQGRSYFEQDAATALTLFTSQLACRTVGFLDTLQPVQQAPLQTNADQFARLIAEISSIYNSQAAYGSPAPSPYNNPVRSPYGAPAQHAHVNPAAGGLYGSGQQQQQQRPVPRQGIVAAAPRTEASQALSAARKYGMITVNQAPDGVREEPKPAPAPVQFEQQQPTALKSFDLYDETSDMDRELHLIPYFGRTYDGMKSIPRDVLETAVVSKEKELSTESSVAADAAWDSKPATDDVWNVETTLEELLNVVRVKALDASGSEFKILKYHGFVVKPIIGRVNLKSYFELVRNVATFADFSSETRAFLDQCQSKPAAELRGVIAMLSSIDSILTKMVSEFLTGVIPNPSFSSSSIIEDGSDILKMLNQTYSGRYNDAFMKYQRSVFGSFFKHTSIEDDAMTAVSEYEHGDNVHVDQVAESYSVLYINAMAADLKLVETAGCLEIENHELMRRLLAANAECGRRELEVTRHILLLADGSRYQIYNRPFEASFVIKKV